MIQSFSKNILIVILSITLNFYFIVKIAESFNEKENNQKKSLSINLNSLTVINSFKNEKSKIVATKKDQIIVKKKQLKSVVTKKDQIIKKKKQFKFVETKKINTFKNKKHHKTV